MPKAVDLAGGSRPDPWKHVKASHNQHLVQLLEDSLQKEDRRLSRLMAAANPSERKRLEVHFNVERDRDRKLFELVKQDHAAALRRKVRASIAAPPSRNQAPDAAKAGPPQTTMKKAVSLGSITPNNQAVGHSHRHGTPAARLPTRQGWDLPPPTRLRPLTSSSSTSQKRTSTPVQADAFRTYVTLKLETAPKVKPREAKGSLTADRVHEHTARMSQEKLLVEKCNLLKQLHHIVTKQQRILEDDQVTVRSGVSSYKSLPTNATLDYNYVPFASTS